MKSFYRFGTLALTALALAGIGCRDNAVNALTEASASEDAAATVAGAIGQDNGGVLDQANDVAGIATSEGLSGQAGYMADAYGKVSGGQLPVSIDTSYDASTGTWTLHLVRQRGQINGQYYAMITRTYTYQFLNAAGAGQKYWRVPNGNGGVDTAVSAAFKIVNGTGVCVLPHLSHKLTGLSGSWTVTGLNTPTVTLNGTYTRSAIDTITTRNAVRTLDHTLNLTFTNITGPRGSRNDWAQKTSGTITGTFTGLATFTKGTQYAEKQINRTIKITLGSKTTAGVTVTAPGGGVTNYSINTQTGELL